MLRRTLYSLILVLLAGTLPAQNLTEHNDPVKTSEYSPIEPVDKNPNTLRMVFAGDIMGHEIGRASCRERV